MDGSRERLIDIKTGSKEFKKAKAKDVLSQNTYPEEKTTET